MADEKPASYSDQSLTHTMVNSVPRPGVPIEQNLAKAKQNFWSDDPEIFYTSNEKRHRICCASRTMPFVMNHFAANQRYLRTFVVQ